MYAQNALLLGHKINRKTAPPHTTSLFLLGTTKCCCCCGFYSLLLSSKISQITLERTLHDAVVVVVHRMKWKGAPIISMLGTGGVVVPASLDRICLDRFGSKRPV